MDGINNEIKILNRVVYKAMEILSIGTKPFFISS